MIAVVRLPSRRVPPQTPGEKRHNCGFSPLITLENIHPSPLTKEAFANLQRNIRIFKGIFSDHYEKTDVIAFWAIQIKNRLEIVKNIPIFTVAWKPLFGDGAPVWNLKI